MDSPVLMYKPQGTCVEQVGQCKGLGVHDFALVVRGVGRGVSRGFRKPPSEEKAPKNSAENQN